mgnify:CR=1 FL=1
MKKKVALLIPHHFSLYEAITKNLETNGYDVILLVLTDKDFNYKNALEKANNFIRKTFFNDKNFKSKLRVKHHSETLNIALGKLNDMIDYTLVIRPDYFTTESLIELKKKSHFFCAYQWDGFSRYPNIVDYITLFDKFFVFDKDDYIQYKNIYNNIFPTTNFYVDNIEKDSKINNNEVFFLGSYLEDRIDEIISISHFFKKRQISSNIQIVYNRTSVPPNLKKSNIKIITKPKKYLEMLDEIKKSKYLLEFQNTSIHNGLSFRVFEALFFSKKLITNNNDVKNYDFYNPNNIFVWENQDYDSIIDFLEKDYEAVDNDILKKYSFSNWFNYIFNITPNKPIQHK